MAKTRTPFFGLGSRGSVGDSITSQKRGSVTLIRQKPVPVYRRTLPQAYQRWLYEDYAYLWTLQTDATRRQYARMGSPYHLTAFQYWMSYHLAKLPDIAGWWKLDEYTGAIAHDSSRNDNHGTIIGASPAVGVIDGGYLLDGLNDELNFGSKPAFQNMSARTVLLFTRLTAFTGIFRYLEYQGMLVSPYGDAIRLNTINNRIDFFLRTDIASISPARIFTSDTWCLIGYSWDGAQMFCFIDTDFAPPIAIAGTFIGTGSNLVLGRKTTPPPNWCDAYTDNLIIYNRGLDQTEITRWSKRRYSI